MAKDYISVVYDEKRTPKTDYPSKLTEYLVDRFKIKKGVKFLEIGCGRGEFLKAFQEVGLDCIGLEINDSLMIDKKNIRVVYADASKEKLPFADGTFDFVYHKSLIEHMYNPDNLMEETFRVLKPGGRVIIMTPDWTSTVKVFYEDFTHCRPYDVTALRDLMSVYGFSEIKTELFHQLPTLWKYPALKMLSGFLRIILSTPNARKLTGATGVKFFRWSVELMVLGSGVKK